MAAQLRRKREQREALAIRYLPLARKLARRYARSNDLEELEQVAALGLVKASRRFDPERGNGFASFAVPTIVGELKRHLRDTRWAVHVPRDLQERAQSLAGAADRLASALGRAPTVGELAAELGLSVEEVLEGRAAFTGMDAASLDAPAAAASADEDTSTLGDTVGIDDPAYENMEELSVVAGGLSTLGEQERLTLALRFYLDLTQVEIGERLGMSQMQVSRIISRSLSTLSESAAAA